MNHCSNAEGLLACRTGPGQVILQQPFPKFLDWKLEQRYENVFCTAVRIAESQSSEQIAAYVAGDETTSGTIVLYRQARETVTVMNEYFAISVSELGQMAAYIFKTIPRVQVISFPSVASDDTPISFTNQRFNSSEDIVVVLPATSEDYCRILGRNTRATIRRSEKSMTERYPGMQFTVHDRNDGGANVVDILVELSRQRITSKNERPSHTQSTVSELRRMVDAYGVLLVARMDEKICGGVICTSVGRHFYMHVVAHDPAFNDIRLGMLCCYRSICEAIRRGAAEYHLLSGKYDYKFRFLGQQRDFEKIVIYRSLAVVLPNISTYVRTLVRGRGRSTKQQLIRWRHKWKT